MAEIARSVVVTTQCGLSSCEAGHAHSLEGTLVGDVECSPGPPQHCYVCCGVTTAKGLQCVICVAPDAIRSETQNEAGAVLMAELLCLQSWGSGEVFCMWEGLQQHNACTSPCQHQISPQ